MTANNTYGLGRDYDGQSLCVFCGSSPGNHPRYVSLAAQTGQDLARAGYRLVYGGGGLGLMGAVARAAHESGGNVLGIMPEFLRGIEGAYMEVPHRIVEDMHTRKRQMYDESDAFIVLPGGIGTLEEAVEVLSWMRLDLHQKPIIFLDNDDYWSPLLSLLDHIVETEFSPAWMKKRIFRATTAQGAIELARACLDDPSHESVMPVISPEQM
jgi:uncharacterized protein (TIGR00730 family)